VLEIVTDEPSYAYYAETTFYACYSLLYCTFVFVHLKRDKSDCVVSVPLFVFTAALNTVLMLLVMSMMLYEALVYGTWLIVATFGVITLRPFVNAIISGSCEGLAIMVKALPVFVLATPAFIAFMSAYNMSRLADLTWGNRLTISRAKAAQRRKSLALPGDAGGATDSDLLERWLQKQMFGCKVLNTLIVAANVTLMVFFESILKTWAFLPEIQSARDTLGVYDSALELCIIFSSLWAFLRFIGFCFHAIRQIKLSCGKIRRGVSKASARGHGQGVERGSSGFEGSNPMTATRAQPQKPPPGRKKRGPSVWEVVFDPSSWYNYYVNSESGESAWDPPEGWKGKNR